jgi:hypothetical protein
MLMVGLASGVDWHSLMRSDPAVRDGRSALTV